MFTLGHISNATATEPVVNSEVMYLEIKMNGGDWYYWNSRHHSDGFVRQLAETFMNNHAINQPEPFLTYSPYPTAIFRTREVEGVYYVNGAIALTDTEDGLIIELWIEKDTVRLFNYPTPEETDGDSSI